MAACSSACGEGLLYTGLSQSDIKSERISAIIVVDTIAADNTKNEILKTDVLDSVYINGKLNESDKTKRWNVIKNLEEYISEITDKALVTSSSGQSYATSGGEIQTVKYNVWNVSETYAKKLEEQFCKDLSFYEIDTCGTIKGIPSADGLSIEPIPMHGSSGSVKFVAASPGVLPQAQISFEIKEYVNQLNRVIIGKNVIELNLNQVESMQQVLGVVTLPTSTGFTVKMNGIFGYSNQENKIVGGLLAGFTLKNAAGVVIAITSVTAQATPNNNLYDVVATIPTGATSTIEFFQEGFEMIPTDVVVP